MGLVKGGFLRLFQTFLYALAFCCAAIVLGIFSYFLAALHDHNQHIPTWERAVEGLSGAAVLYTIFTTILTCCLAGITFLSILGFLLDLCFVGAFIAIAVLTRHGADNCSNNVNTPLGSGLASNQTNTGIRLRTACKLNTAVFAVSIVAAVIFLITALMQLLLIKNHRKEKRYGPSPDNDYTEGRGRRTMFVRKNKTVPVDAEKGPIRPSHDTAYTGSTVASPNLANLQKDEPVAASADPHAGHAPHAGWNPHSGTVSNTYASDAERAKYYTAPVDSSNPYGYESTTATGTGRNF